MSDPVRDDVIANTRKILKSCSLVVDPAGALMDISVTFRRVSESLRKMSPDEARKALARLSPKPEPCTMSEGGTIQ